MNPFKTQKGFYKIWLLFILAISIPVVTIGYLAIHNSTTHIIKQVDRSSNILLVDKKQLIERQMSEIVNLTNQIMASDEVWELFEPYENYSGRAQAMFGVIRYLNKLAVSNKSIVSIYLINKEENYVLADSKYNLDDFFDQDILKLPAPETFSVLPMRSVVALGTAGRNVVSAVRPFKNVSSDAAMSIVVNIEAQDFVSSLLTTDSQQPMTLFILNDDNELVLNNTGFDPATMREQFPAILHAEGSSSRQTLDGTDYFLSKARSDFLGWTLVYAQPYEQVVNSVKLLRHVIVYSGAIVLLIAFVLAYLFSSLLYRPLARLVGEVRAGMSTIGKGKDEYSVISGAMNALFQENRTLQSQFGLAFPYMKQHSVLELLGGKTWEDEKFRAVIQLMGKSFDKPRFAVGVLDLENTDLTDSFVDQAELFFEERLQTMLLSIIHERRLALIVNTELEKEEIYTLFRELKETLNEEGALLTLSVSSCFDSLNKLVLAYQEALQLLNHKFFVGKNELIVKEAIQAAETNGRFYDKQLEESLLDSIRSQQLEKALETAGTLIGLLSNHSSSIGYVKYAVFQICSNLIGALSDMGGQLEEAGIDGPSIWDSVQQADTMAELARLLERFIHRSMNVTAELKHKQHTEIVAKTMAFIRGHYRQSLSLKDISTHVYLSPGHLSTIFKNETGITIYDYVTQIRMEAAAQLIMNSEAKIQDIAQAVGYNNTQSFVRFFKKAYRMTPLEYRRKLVLYDS